MSVSQSCEALDELKKRADITPAQHKQLVKIVGFHNVLVHDYLEINNAIVEAIVIQQQYLLLDGFILRWQQELALLPAYVKNTDERVENRVS